MFVLDMVTGAVHVSVADVWASLTGRASDQTTGYIIQNFRLPKTLMALLAGASLSAAGLQMQTLFRNPLADPFILGVSSGAGLGAALYSMGLPLLGVSVAGSWLASVGMVGAAWIGAAVIMLLVMAVTARVKDIMVVLILGIMFGSAATAMVSLLQYMSSEGALKSYVMWTMGSLGSVALWQFRIIVPALLLGLVMSVALIKPLNMMLLGENYARSMGLDIKRTRFLIFGTVILLAGTITAFCGPLSFVGLAVPHVARMIFREADHKVLMPASMVLGAAVMMLCDMATQLAPGDMTLPINTVTSLIGIPVVIIVIFRNRKLT